MMKTGQTFDAVTLEVLWGRLIAIVNEAAVALMRTSFSTVVREAQDFSCIIADAEGRGVAQPPHSIPSFIGTLPDTVKHFIDEYPVAGMRPGDVFITNDPWKGTGHLADVSVCKPIFLGDRVVAFAASTAHAPDMGGRTGSSESRDVFEEGFQIPPMHLCRQGEPDQSLVRLLRTNVREPDEVLGDIWAQVTALELIETRLLSLMQGAGLESLAELAGEIHDRCETAMRNAIRAVPNGIYRYRTATDGMADPVELCVAIEVSDDSLTVDFEGTSPQLDRALNSAMCYTRAYTMYGLKCLLSPEVPNNEGAFRPIEIKAPAGSVLNHRYPYSGCSRALIGHYLPFIVCGALAEAIPERVRAGAGSPVWGVLMRGLRANGQAFSAKFFYNGGMGGSASQDGISCISWPTNLSITQTEIVEQSLPCEIVYKRVRPGSGGDGEFRGGLGQELLFESTSDRPIVLVFMAERTRTPAPGFFGGQPGSRGVVVVNGKEVDSKLEHVLPPRGTFLIGTPGGGGFGDPAARSGPARARDRQLGYV
ncbi:MAG: hydantoinase B/oxoprolinase family protein [Lautropia sp.]